MNSGSSSKFRPFDICVITAANEYQAMGYENQLDLRKSKGYLPEGTEFFVFADPNGKRIGSGGSTIYVLYKLLEHFSKTSQYKSLGEVLEKRISIIHSGGDSRRLPAYSPVGKLFFPLPTDFFPLAEKDGKMDGFVTIFDLFLNNLSYLPYQENGQVIVASGDVLLVFDGSKAVIDELGVTGVAYPGPFEVATNHGVYIVGENHSSDKPVKVSDFLQKPTYDELEKCNGFDLANRAFIDTGIMNFANDAVKTLMDASGISIDDKKILVESEGLADLLINGDIQFDIYKEMPFAMLGKDMDDPFKGSIKEIPFLVSLLPFCEFFHAGTSRHLIQNFHAINYTASTYDFRNYNKSSILDKSILGNAFVYNSMIKTTNLKSRGASFIEGCQLDGKIRLEGNNIITGIPKTVRNIDLEEGNCITCIPIIRKSDEESEWVSVIYGIEDDFKRVCEDPKATFLNMNFMEWMKYRDISFDILWNDGDNHDVWNARIFPFHKCSDASLQSALKLQLKYKSHKNETDSLESWKSMPRMSLKEILESVDYKRLLDNYSELYRAISLENLADLITSSNELSSDKIISWCEKSGNYVTAAEKTFGLIEQETDNKLHQARLYKLLSNITNQAREKGVVISDSDIPNLLEPIDYEDKAFELVREAIRTGLDFGHKPQRADKISIRSDEVVWVSSAVRFDFAGGWSDTPPYCLEYGGSVLNAAVKLNGQYPIQVIGKLHDDYAIKINSIDLGEHITISDTSQMKDFDDPSVWTALPKASLIASGIIPEDLDFDLHDTLKRLGSGIDLTLFSAVPAGSGLGTSSILASAVIACLSKIVGQELTHEDLFNRTLYTEQLMTTGGGWQDQIGGFVGGVKHIQTEPGLYQIPRISWTDLKIEHNVDLSERFLLYYTGLRRMAKGILKNIVGKYLDRDEIVINTISQLREMSIEMKTLLDHRDIDNFGKSINKVWELNKVLDPGTTNDEIEKVLDMISPHIYGAKLLGAGGGGFFFIVTKGAKQSQIVKSILENDPPNHRARFYNFDIDMGGLKINVL